MRFRELFAGLIHTSAERIAVIPSASYGLMNAVRNIPSDQGDHILLVEDEFPSGYMAARRWANDRGKELKQVPRPEWGPGFGKEWNERLVNAINENTAAVLVSSVHWSYGTRMDLNLISEACQKCDAWLIVDGSQSVGVQEINVERLKLDALVTVSYKWLLGPYGLGMAYYGPRYDGGQAIEESWMHREGSENFSSLIPYGENYKQKAGRYSVGEVSKFCIDGHRGRCSGADQFLGHC